MSLPYSSSVAPTCRAVLSAGCQGCWKIGSDWLSHVPHSDPSYGPGFCVQDLVLLIRGGQECCSIHCLWYWCSFFYRLVTKWKEAWQPREDLWGKKGLCIFFHRQEFKVEKIPFPCLFFYFPLVSDPEEQLWMETVGLHQLSSSRQ